MVNDLLNGHQWIVSVRHCMVLWIGVLTIKYRCYTAYFRGNDSRLSADIYNYSVSYVGTSILEPKFTHLSRFRTSAHSKRTGKGHHHDHLPHDHLEGLNLPVTPLPAPASPVIE